MSKNEKLIRKVLANPVDFTWEELINFLTCFGYQELTGPGSRRKFIGEEMDVISGIHKPHGANSIKRYQLKRVIEHLKEKGKL